MDMSFVRLSILIVMRQAWELTCMNESLDQIKITWFFRDMTIFFLIQLKKSQKEQFIKTKQEDSDLCFHGIMTDELSFRKAPQNKRSFLCIQKQFHSAEMPF